MKSAIEGINNQLSINYKIKKLDSRNSWYAFTVLFIIFDYTRIYNDINLSSLRPLLIISIILIYFIIESGDYRTIKSKQLFLIWSFVLLLFIYVPFARNSFFAFGTARDQFVYMPFIISVVLTIKSIERFKNFILILICVQIYIAIYAIFHAGYGPGNYFDDENDLALYVNMWIPFCYFLFFSYRGILKKIICFSGLIFGLLSVVVSFSRGGFIGLVTMGIVVWLFSKRKVFSLLIVIVLSGLVFIYAGDQYWSEMSTVTNSAEGTGRARIESWKSAWYMFIDRPFGVGGNNFQVWFPEYQTDWFKRGMWGRVAHSLWFTLIPELGILGIYIYISLLYKNIKVIFKFKNIYFNDNDEDRKYFSYFGRALIASFAGYFSSGTFISVLYYAHYWYLVGLIICAKNLLESEGLISEVG